MTIAIGLGRKATKQTKNKQAFIVVYLLHYNMFCAKVGKGGIRLDCAVTCDFQQCDILTSVDSDKPVQPPFKLGKSK